jgi:Flp pilus assembly protein TadB
MNTIKINNIKDFEQYKSAENIDTNIEINCELEAKNLKSVGGDLSINSQAKLEAKNLKSVAEYLYINSQAIGIMVFIGLYGYFLESILMVIIAIFLLWRSIRGYECYQES